MGMLSWRWWPRNKTKSLDDAEFASERFEGGDRRHLLQALSAMAGGGALAVLSQPAEAKDASDLPPTKRALTGRDDAGKSVFKSFDVTTKVVEIDSNPGLTFYELYMTEGVPRLTGLEADPMLEGTKAFPGPGGTMFRLISYPPKRPEGYKPPAGVTFESGFKEMSDKVPRMGDHFDRSAPGMHTSDTIDYCVVVRGEMTLELDDGQKVQLRQGDCVVQNGTRHRWRNPLPAPSDSFMRRRSPGRVSTWQRSMPSRRRGSASPKPPSPSGEQRSRHDGTGFVADGEAPAHRHPARHPSAASS